MKSNRPPLFYPINPREEEAMILVESAVLDPEQPGRAVIEFTTKSDGAFHFAVPVHMLREIGQHFIRSSLVLSNTATDRQDK